MIVEVGALFLREASNFGRGGSYTAPPSLGTQAWPWGRTWQICTWGLCGSGQPTWSAIGKFALGPTRAWPTHVVDYLHLDLHLRKYPTRWAQGSSPG